MSKFHQAKSLLKHLLQAQTKFYLHSPFIHELAEEVIYDQRHYYAFDRIESLRKVLQKSNELVEVHDLGAGSQQMKSKQRKVADIARHASATPNKGQLLFKLSRYFKATKMLELGTALGLGTAYITSGNQSAQMTSIEGCPNLAQLSRRNLNAVGLKKVNVVQGDFKKMLPQVLQANKSFDLIYLDGNHQYQPTLDYFNQCTQHISQEGIIILDDIHWSVEMEKAWAEIVAHKTVTLSIDMYDIGVVFFRKELSKEHFRLKWWKSLL